VLARPADVRPVLQFCVGTQDGEALMSSAEKLRAEGPAEKVAELVLKPLTLRMANHRVVEERSLRYHAAIAARLLLDATILPRIRERVEEWIRTGTVAAYYAEAWRDVLCRPVSEISAWLRDDSETARALRPVSPFAGVLSARERWQLWAAADGGDDATAT
jgi:hypothetical protein